MTLEFTFEEIASKYQVFVSSFLSDETNVEKEEVLPRLWMVIQKEKDFKASIECKCIGKWHGIEQWCAVVTEPNGEEHNYMLFEEEIEGWAAEQRRLRGFN